MTITAATPLTVGTSTTRCEKWVTHAAWQSYRTAFEPINALAAQRHLMTYNEFETVMTDARVRKHFATVGGHLVADGTVIGGQVVGMSVITNDLWAWPLISPAYFARRWPTHYRQNRIFYVGFVLALPNAPITTFRDLIADMAQPVFACQGIAVMDFCTANVDRKVPAATDRILHRLHPDTNGDRVDAQEFWAWRFDGEPIA